MSIEIVDLPPASNEVIQLSDPTSGSHDVRINLYADLAIPRSATQQIIRKAYAKLALKHHPDRNSSPESKHIFDSVALAYDVLSNEQRRAIYDQYGMRGLKEGIKKRTEFEGFAGGYEFHGDGLLLFTNFFGGPNPFTDFYYGDQDSHPKKFGKAFGGLQGMNMESRCHTEKVKQDDIEHTIFVTLSELYHGTLKKRQISRKILNEDGASSTSIETEIAIAIEKGAQQDKRIRFAAMGDEAVDQLPADLVFVVKQIPHDTYKRDGDNLHHTAKITLKSALSGTILNLQTLDGRLLKIPILQVIDHAFVKVIAGEGMPKGNKGVNGDLIVRFEIQFPKQLSIKAREQIKRIFDEEESASKVQLK